MADKWIQRASDEMERKGTKGAFTKEAKAHGESVGAFASHVLSKGSKASALTKKRAVFAQNMRRIARNRR